MQSNESLFLEAATRIDSVLESAATNVSTTQLVEFGNAIADALDADRPLTPRELLTDQHLSHTDQKFLATCLLRLLAANDAPFEDREMRVRTVELFDVVYADDIYKEKHINLKDQTHEKLPKLKDVVPHIEQRIQHEIDSLTVTGHPKADT